MRHGILNGAIACSGKPLTTLRGKESAIDTRRLVTCPECKNAPSDRSVLAGIFNVR